MLQSEPTFHCRTAAISVNSRRWLQNLHVTLYLELQRRISQPGSSQQRRNKDAAMLGRVWQMEVIKYKVAYLYFQAGYFLINLQFIKFSMLPGVLPGSLCWLLSGEVKTVPPLVHCAHGMTTDTGYIHFYIL